MSREIDGSMRRRLQGLAYRMLGSTHDAEDAVSEAVLRWQQLPPTQRAEIREPVAWLTRVVSRICLDQLRSARVRREQYRGIWLPEPQVEDDPARAAATGGDPADRVTLDDSVSFAFLTALERLTPAERVSLILHDVFGLQFAEIADTVGRTPAACRQLAASGRRHLRDHRRYDVPDTERRRVVQVFLDACQGGDLARLIEVLDPRVVSVADGGDQIRVAQRPVIGAEKVAHYLIRVMATQRRQMTQGQVATVDTVNGRPGIIIRNGDTLAGTVDLSMSDHRVTRVHIQVNPVKLPG